MTLNLNYRASSLLLDSEIQQQHRYIIRQWLKTEILLLPRGSSQLIFRIDDWRTTVRAPRKSRKKFKPHQCLPASQLFLTCCYSTFFNWATSTAKVLCSVESWNNKLCPEFINRTLASKTSSGTSIHGSRKVPAEHKVSVPSKAFPHSEVVMKLCDQPLVALGQQS